MAVTIALVLIISTENDQADLALVAWLDSNISENSYHNMSVLTWLDVESSYPNGYH